MSAADAVEPRAAGDAVGERDAVEEERARERAEQEVLERRLGAGGRIAADAGQHVDGERQHLERQKDHQQIGRPSPSASCRRGQTASARSTRPAAAARARWSAPENASDSRPTMIRIQVTNRPKLSATTTPKLVALWSQSSARRDRRADETDGAERTNRHPLAGRAERLGHHRGDGRRGHAQHRDDGVQGDHRAGSGLGDCRGSDCGNSRLGTAGPDCASGAADPAGLNLGRRLRPDLAHHPR